LAPRLHRLAEVSQLRFAEQVRCHRQELVFLEFDVAPMTTYKIVHGSWVERCGLAMSDGSQLLAQNLPRGVELSMRAHDAHTHVVQTDSVRSGDCAKQCGKQIAFLVLVSQTPSGVVYRITCAAAWRAAPSSSCIGRCALRRCSVAHCLAMRS
jgi:hypothetical protein